jgi:hypothetical protein
VCVPAGSYRWAIQVNRDQQDSFYYVDRNVDRSRRVHLDLAKAKRKP